MTAMILIIPYVATERYLLHSGLKFLCCLVNIIVTSQICSYEKKAVVGRLVAHTLLFQVRRAHLNDLENVIPFVLMSLLYVGTKPDPVTALWHFRVRLVLCSAL